MRSSDGFSVVELLTIIAIVSLLAGVAMFNAVAAAQRSRDVDRQADLRVMQSALELYKQRNGRYPAGCRGPNVYSGQIGTNYSCSGGSSQYIIGLAPEFIPVLPSDKSLVDTDSGYMYTTNNEGTAYKLLIKKTVESEVVDYDSPFKSCDVTHLAGGICDSNKPSYCEENNSTFQTSYAVWGGFARGLTAQAIEQGTRDVICD
jgi:type II secretory pathway pseudopilin PulG